MLYFLFGLGFGGGRGIALCILVGFCFDFLFCWGFFHLFSQIPFFSFNYLFIEHTTNSPSWELLDHEGFWTNFN